MQNLKTLSLTGHVNDWLANTRAPCILHVFDQAYNLINERREVLSIVTPQIGNGPFNLVIDGDISFSAHLNADSPISIYSHQLRLGDLTIHTGDAKLWSAIPVWEGLHAKKDDIPGRITTSPSINYQPLFPASLLMSFASAVVNADVPSALTKQLAGLGRGLTPSGDDILMGAMHAAWIIHPAEIAQKLAQEIAQTAAPLTTSLSGAWLRSAARGEAGILWHDFFNALTAGNSLRTQDAMVKILAIGETSGIDALAGFRSIFISYAKVQAKPCPS